jgi:acetoin utilization deacetylase AcuC-like enzyme
MVRRVPGTIHGNEPVAVPADRARPDEADHDPCTTTTTPIPMAVLTVIGPDRAADHRAERHPERPERVDAVAAGIDDLDLCDEVDVEPARPATDDELARVHRPEYLDRLRGLSQAGGGALDPDTYATGASWEAARRAAGSGLAAAARLRTGGGIGLVAARPPGHHALADRAMGFCLLNNVAVTARCLVDEGERVAIVDWDVHHGNGTQAVFWDDPHVLYVSLHQWPCYPGTGRAGEVGGPGAPGLTVNLPLPPGATGDVVDEAFERVAAPVIEAFAPTWVLVSAGFDAHRADPLAELALSGGDFARLAVSVAGLCPPDRMILHLEGGYDLRALRTSVAATLGALTGARPGAGEEAPTAGGTYRGHVDELIARRRAGLDELA